MNEFDDDDLTRDHHAGPAADNNPVRRKHPQRIGRYRVEKVLGSGGFGLVYLAHDETLDRPVAVKVPHSHIVSRSKDAEFYLAEARTVASLEHPHIVPVHDVGSSSEFPCFIVSRFVPGSDLATHLKQTRLSYSEATELVATVAEALHYAHKHGIVHRDVKPGNILVDAGGKPFVVDFGLALREESVGKGSRHVGTPAYMSPEQARGEGHRVDGRSDIFSLGVLFYEMLVGRRPFRADTQAEMLDQILTLEPRPLSQYDERIPKELQRICLKALSKRASDRFSSAHEMAEDLRHFLSSSKPPLSAADPMPKAGSTETGVPLTPTERNSAKSPQLGSASYHPVSDSLINKIVPKGLRSFDSHDADFFLELLPGARDRTGLPESIRFWKTHIESIDPDEAFSIGLIYGPSGCGKSSLVKAGLLPRLASDFIAVYLEASPDETELRLLSGLRKRFPLLDEQLSLTQSIAMLRRGEFLPAGKKILIVIDQFEQWLHATRDQENTELVAALRQCDGEHVQCIVMVRDDFWMAATRFMRELEVRLVEGHNSAAVDLFPIRHAEKVLAAFGRAFGAFPSETKTLSKEQSAFLTQSIAGLAEEGKVVCVRLALFAEMFKDKPWTPAALREVGGTTGVGVTFLEETFVAKTAPPEHRLHQAAARGVLKDLLPDSGTEIKGHMRSREELLAASGYVHRPKDFEELLRILDSSIRLITPTDPEGNGNSPSASNIPLQDSYFVLTHDYLVPSLREWLTRKQRETPKGRAELKLEERTAVWNTKRENKQLPSTLEWLQIRWHADRYQWTESQRDMMRTASKVHLRTWGGTFAALLAIGALFQFWVVQQDWNNKREQTRLAAESLQNNLGPSIPVLIGELKKLPDSLVREELAKRFATDNSRHKLALSFALAAYGRVEAKYLVSWIDNLAINDTANFVGALASDRELSLEAIKTEADSCTASSLWKRKARLAIAALALSDTEIAADMCQYDNRPDPGQRTILINEFPKWEWQLPNRSINLQQLAQTLAGSHDSGLRSGISLAVGSIPADQLKELNATPLDTWTKLAARWFVEHRDTSTHGASTWLLHQWKHPLPDVPDKNKVLPDRDWFENSVGMTMLRIKPPTAATKPANELDDSSDQQRQLSSKLPESEYWIASCEVTRSQFELFIRDGDYQFEKPTDWDGIDTKISPTGNHPAQTLNWYDSVMYCNWLSRREGKTPVYRKTGKEEEAGYEGKVFDQWESIPNTTGYRLLRKGEWEFAARAGSAANWSSGDDEKLLIDYCQMYPSKIASEVGYKLPNPWGLQDMHGNVWEWCYDLVKGMGSSREIRGGGWGDIADFSRAANRQIATPSYRVPLVGFRLALSSSGETGSAAQIQETEPAGGSTEGASAEQRPEIP